MDLTEFLLARITEDERMAQEWRSDGAAIEFHEYGDVLVKDARPWVRVLAECEAKRRIVALASWSGQKIGVRDRIFGPAADEAFRQGIKAAMRALALPYAYHPDYQQDWKP